MLRGVLSAALPLAGLAAAAAFVAPQVLYAPAGEPLLVASAPSLQHPIGFPDPSDCAAEAGEPTVHQLEYEGADGTARSGARVVALELDRSTHGKRVLLIVLDETGKPVAGHIGHAEAADGCRYVPDSTDKV